jgi:hypothetical protein
MRCAANIHGMTRVVGKQDRSPFLNDPEAALRAGRRLDAMLQAARVPHPRGVFRGPHRYLNELDERRAVEAARRLNAA